MLIDRGLGLTHILGVIQFIENIDHVGRFALPKYDSLTSLPWTIDQVRERETERERQRESLSYQNEDHFVARVVAKRQRKPDVS
jgi:hypothetical protein